VPATVGETVKKRENSLNTSAGWGKTVLKVTGGGKRGATYAGSVVPLIPKVKVKGGTYKGNRERKIGCVWLWKQTDFRIQTQRGCGKRKGGTVEERKGSSSDGGREAVQE